MTAFSLALSLLVSLPFLYVLARRPVLRRLAVRNAVRRPREAALVVVGSLLGAAIITGSMVVGDTMDASIRQIARTHLGPIDELVSVRDAREQKLLVDALRAAESPNVDGVLGLATVQAAATSTGARVLSAPRSQIVALDFTAARAFGGDPDATGVSGTTPSFGRAAITTDLARTLDAGPGSRIAVHAYGRMTSLVVDRVLPRRGIAGFWTGLEQEANNVLVSRRTFALVTAGGGGAALPTWSVAVSNRGGVESGAPLSDAVSAHIRDVAIPAGLNPQVLSVKERALAEAEAVGEGYTTMFTAMGSFGVLAGLLLLVNLFVMLAAERKTELGMARAVGMRRSALVGAFATEGWFYAAVATALGVVVGIGLGAVLVAVSSRIFASEHSRFDLAFTLVPGHLVQTFALGLVVALVTIVATSLRVSRLNIIRAIRDIPEPPARAGRRRWLVAGIAAAALGAVLTVQGWSSRDGFALLLGPVLVVVGLTPLASRLVPPRRAQTAAALLVVAWGASMFALVPSATKGASIMLFVVQGVVLTAAAVTLVSIQQERLSRGLRKVARGRSLPLRLGLAYPIARRSRTGLTIAMYALVVFILTFITALAHMIDQEVTAATKNVRGGYDVVVSSSAANPLPAREIATLDGVENVVPLARASGLFRLEGSSEDVLWNVTGFDKRFLRGGPPKLEDRGAYATERAAWEAVRRNPRLVVVDTAFMQTGGPPQPVEPGTQMTLKDPFTGRKRRVTVAAVASGDVFIGNGVFYGLGNARALFGYPLALDRLYVALRRPALADTFAADVQGRFVRNGAEAVSIEAIMDESFTMTRQIFQLFEGYLAMGLIVGIAGSAVVMIRAVRERRRQIGTLRALGFGARPVGRSFAIEAGFVAVEGTVIGCALALVTLYDIVALSDSFGELDFSVPYLSLAILLLGTVAASLVATVWPALSASRIRPAVALRTTD